MALLQPAVMDAAIQERKLQHALMSTLVLLSFVSWCVFNWVFKCVPQRASSWSSTTYAGSTCYTDDWIRLDGCIGQVNGRVCEVMSLPVTID